MEKSGDETKRQACASQKLEGKKMRAYDTPTLVLYGDVRDLTLGGSGAILETGPFGPDGCKLNGQDDRSCLP